MATGPVAVYLEVGARRVFACALDWPGWCRSGRDEERALEALAAAAPRYMVAAKEAGIRFPARAGEAFDVVERIPGTATTDFGAPGEAAAADAESLSRKQAGRQTALVTASWTILDRVAAAAPAELRKGPRGGGRDRDAIVEHVAGAEFSYARKLGIRHRQPGPGDAGGSDAAAEAVSALRQAIVETLGQPSAGEAPVPKGWKPRYAARRIAWHALDHAWEIEDRSSPPSSDAT
jgi:hypothetical protein